MALEQKLALKLSQKLVMTPSLQQAIKLLQMTKMELEGVVTQELVENPTLEEVTEIREETVDKEREREAEPEKNESEELDHEESMDNIDLEAYFGDYFETSGYASMNEQREGPPIENSLSRQPDLYDHLLWQLHMDGEISPRQREVAEIIIGNLDPDGFLMADVSELCAMGMEEANGDGGTTYSEREVEEALALVRSYDPPGIACRDLRESLLLQLDQRDEPEDSLARRMIEGHWDLFLKRQFQVIAKKMGVGLHELEPAVELIKTLETRPGRGYGNERTHYIEPDVYVRKVGGDYVIQINDDGMPRLRISRAYRRMLQTMKSEGRQAEAQQFIKEKIRSAVWLIKSLDQRQRTIYKVANSIAQQQREFLEHGIERLRPMVLRDVAEDIQMHESTVSRVVSNKYIHTPRGLFPMKFFFHSGIDRDYGDNISSLTVKRKIEELIGAEDSKKPLSDSQLMKILNREGIQIARRTVAKYRDELSIPSSTDRKKIF